MGTGLITIALLLYCGLFDVHPNLIAVSMAILWTAYIVETKG